MSKIHKGPKISTYTCTNNLILKWLNFLSRHFSNKTEKMAKKGIKKSMLLITKEIKIKTTQRYPAMSVLMVTIKPLNKLPGKGVEKGRCLHTAFKDRTLKTHHGEQSRCSSSCRNRTQQAHFGVYVERKGSQLIKEILASHVYCGTI